MSQSPQIPAGQNLADNIILTHKDIAHGQVTYYITLLGRDSSTHIITHTIGGGWENLNCTTDIRENVDINHNVILDENHDFQGSSYADVYLVLESYEKHVELNGTGDSFQQAW